MSSPIRGAAAKTAVNRYTVIAVAGDMNVDSMVRVTTLTMLIPNPPDTRPAGVISLNNRRLHRYPAKVRAAMAPVNPTNSNAPLVIHAHILHLLIKIYSPSVVMLFARTSKATRLFLDNRYRTFCSSDSQK